MAIYARAVYSRRVLLQFCRLQMAAKTNLLFGRREINDRQVLLGGRQMTYAARKRHGGMHRFTVGLICVARHAVGAFGNNPGMLDG